MKITDEELRDLKDIIFSAKAGDAEDVLLFVGEHGPQLINEILAHRATAGQRPGDDKGSEKPGKDGEQGEQGDEERIFNLALHESVAVTNYSKDKSATDYMCVLRVPGGWIYKTWCDKEQNYIRETFVPFYQPSRKG